MNSDQYQRELTSLQNSGLVASDYSVADNHLSNRSEKHTPWFLQVFIGFGGLLASLFFTGFLTLVLAGSNLLESTVGLIIVGLLLSALGLCLFKVASKHHSLFFEYSAFAISVTGQLYVAAGLFFYQVELPLAVWLFLIIQSCLTFIIPNVVYRLISASIALGVTVYLFNYYQLPELSLGVLALLTIVTQLQRYPLLQRISRQWQAYAKAIISAFGYASALMLLCVSVYFIAAEYGNSFVHYNAAFSYNYYLAQGLLTLASLYAALLILKRYQVKLLSSASIIIVCAIIVLGVMSIYVSGLLATSLIIVIAIANSQRVLLGLGIVALVSYIFWYYYQLDTSLLLKSASMLIVGIGLLLMRWLLIHYYLANSTAWDNSSTPSKNELSENELSKADSQERLL
ncbi:DUF4401 domain-containing protein [Psychrobacter sp. DAB_AL43B]|uniref:DUF4401 domain-containing protein n=1 Tax=Psychrobacter sp. DAB_AL43B TaxID=1028416 RepID=UPI0009C23280|nr:DUF4401 domain-containing protein [Psychrobacter sp. DAB_AL43B]SLJ83246.1 hypothetical protein DABAL43B_0022 [Psychrobacter sp. DAB_AL43B]